MSSLFEVALKEDMAGHYLAAADLYERVLAENRAPIDAYLNLAVLYWESSEIGFQAVHQLPLTFVRRAGQRCYAVLDEAEGKFAEQPEIKFWRLYTQFISVGGASFVEECERLVEEPNASLVPYFYLYMAFGGQQYGDEATRLLDECQKMLTTKNRYIISVIRSVMQSAQ